MCQPVCILGRTHTHTHTHTHPNRYIVINSQLYDNGEGAPEEAAQQDVTTRDQAVPRTRTDMHTHRLTYINPYIVRTYVHTYKRAQAHVDRYLHTKASRSTYVAFNIHPHHPQAWLDATLKEGVGRARHTIVLRRETNRGGAGGSSVEHNANKAPNC